MASADTDRTAASVDADVNPDVESQSDATATTTTNPYATTSLLNWADAVASADANDHCSIPDVNPSSGTDVIPTTANAVAHASTRNLTRHELQRFPRSTRPVRFQWITSPTTWLRERLRQQLLVIILA